MTNIVMLGGNGYIGRNTTEVWMKQDPDTVFYVVSRSGKNRLSDPRIINVQADIASPQEIRKKLPEKVDYIVNFVGCAAVPKGSGKTLTELNMEPVRTLRELGESYNVKAMGTIGGKLGSKEFVKAKKETIDYLKQSSVPVEAVEPALVYGNGRDDSLAKMVPLLKFFGLFSKNMKPVLVTDVAEELVAKMRKHA